MHGRLKYISTALTLVSAIIFFLPGFRSEPKADEKWFPYFDFDAATFQKAPREFGPFTRWWLPGNDLDDDELKREIKMFAENGFAGVEVQPLTQGLNPKAPKEQYDRIYSWDTPSFYAHLGAVMDQAQISKVVVDMNGGSGWPLGGSFFDPKESMKTLAISDTLLKAGQLFQGPLPLVNNHALKPSGMMAAMMSGNFVDKNWAVLQSLIAAKVVKNIGKQTVLDPQTLLDLTSKVQNGKLDWQVPAGGDWLLVASWTIPSGEKPSLVASPKTNYVIDHLDPAIVNKTYDYLLGQRTGLDKYYGKPLRAVFNDSYEFHTDRIISPDFLQVFQSKNGYDIAPWLSSVFQKGYNHPTYLANMYAGAKPPVIFNETENWRIMYDYDATVNQVFKKNFIQTSNNWMNAKGMLHRTQAYGFPIDLIGSAGSADIPEAEQLFAEGSEGYLKLVTSGAHLYNRPVISQESFVSILRAEMTTPQKIKIWADKSLASGINQLIYHGTPYKYNDGTYGKEGWNTWSSPYLPFVNFSTGMNETDPFWKDIKKVNEYIARCQYALRSGKPKTDVLIYMPFIDFTEDQMAMNPEEILYRGYFKEVEPDIQGFGVFAAPDTRINRWYKKLWNIVNELESKGTSWEFVNDESLQKAKLVGGKINIEGNVYQTLLLANLPYIHLETAKHVNTLSKQGLSLVAIGELPSKQPSFFNYEENDRLVAQLIKEATSQKTSRVVNAELLPDGLIKGDALGIPYAGSIKFARQITREMKDGSQIKFIWNKSDQWQTITLQPNIRFKNSYFLNPENGDIFPKTGKTVSYHLAPYGSVILYCTTTAKTGIASAKPNPFVPISEGMVVSKIENWNLKASEIEIKNTPLFDWKNNDQLKHRSDESIYTASFELPRETTNKNSILVDLGKVYYTADVLINGKNAGKRLFSPYQLNISRFVRPGINTIEVRVTTSRRNGFVGEAIKGNPGYTQFKGKENTLVSSGLLGPVIIRKM